ncbi:hypothetical protein LFAB_08815 [Lactiplantibacillus fabifermentans T30PCM01]|uniref:Uncharacterized protein n=2 Tax=Lactiplantibacillus fabifermentans TaxID=483011 RepID=A0A0R2NLM7_9LACO|nr:hypothetical protein [Lactiplantibacillus fabifermentans]ETY74129.1 hypothetical protein LFAB_08815 [Lactiplantibacillus fabifermentans T30PCM01]KRO25730.1 hypothetical protein DY78_GL001181 [Lactiplantibacillus fabifermentans DSM 21115]
MVKKRPSKPNDDRFESLNQLREALEMFLEIRILINNVEWYIGTPQGPRIIASGDFDYTFPTDDADAVLDYVVDGKHIRDQWRDIRIIVM